MKKLFLAACVAVVSAFSLNAQGLAIRAEVGGNFTNIDQKVADKKLDLDMLAGLRAGVGVEYQFAPMIYAATGLNYHMGGSKLTKKVAEKFIIGADSGKIRNHTLSLPVNLGLRAKFGAFGVSADAGPYLSYMLSSKTIGEIPNEIKDGMGKMGLKLEDPTIDNLNDFYKSFEVGVGVSVAAEYLNYYLRLGTNWGLSDISKIDHTTIKNNEFYLALGIRF